MTVLQFPADRRALAIRTCAQTLKHLHGDAANRFWRSEMADFASMLRDQGADEDEISHQAQLFMHAVQLELHIAFDAA